MAAEGSSCANNNEPRPAFLSSHILPCIHKLQRELTWRRGGSVKECQTPLQEAILALSTWAKADTTTRPTVSSSSSAIPSTLDAFLLVLQHSVPKHTKSCELALEGIQLLLPYLDVEDCVGSHNSTRTMYTVEDSSNHSKSSTSPQSAASTTTAATTTTTTDTTVTPSPIQQRLVDGIAAAASGAGGHHVTIQTALIATLTAIVTDSRALVHEHVLLTAVRSTFHIYLITTKACKSTAQAALRDMVKAVWGRMESAAAAATTTKQQESNGPFLSQHHADAYHLLRALCKLSSKELQADNVDEPHTAAKTSATRIFQTLLPTLDPTELHSKLLALELIVTALEHGDIGIGTGGSNNRNSETFVHLLQTYLCGSLLKNCVSNHTRVAFLSQKIFLVLVHKCKGHLKQDIEVVLSNVFFRVLDSPNASFQQKALVLESLRSLCRDPTLLTQIFIDYDCDAKSRSNLYKDIVHVLTKTAARGSSSSGTSSTHHHTTTTNKSDLVPRAAVECLVTILRTFLQALGLPGVDAVVTDRAGARIRRVLHLSDADTATTLLTIPMDDSISSSQHHQQNQESSVISEETTSIVIVPPPGGASPLSSSSPTPAPTLAATAPSGDVASSIVDAFDRKQMAQQNFEIGAVKFTLSLKTGLKFFMDHGFCALHAQAIAQFFLDNKDTLDKTQMGEALGREPDAPFAKHYAAEPADTGGPGFWVRILHHYIDALDFTEMVFDDAIRLFLSGFRLPGEAQKIDRIMEKFAERYTAQNPTVFPSSDTAFILAFSVIMLNTDLHNPSIKPERRMTVESFLRNNRGIGADGGDLPSDFLTGIFDRIKQRPFSLKEDDQARERVGTQKPMFDGSFFENSTGLFGGSTSDDQKREKFKKERDEMMAVTEQLIRRRPGKTSDDNSSDTDTPQLTASVPPADVAKPMFDVTWGPMLGILSQILECSDDAESVSVCLQGFVYAIRLAAHSDMTLARDTFVSSLAKFTFLGSIKEMKRKNVESIRTLLSIAIEDGEHLGESWGPVLQCLSQMSKLRLSASGLDSDESFLLVESPRKSNVVRSVRPLSALKEEQAREAEENNGRAVLEAVNEVLIDKVFSSTVNLSAHSLSHFVEQLIAVASVEVFGIAQATTTQEAPGAAPVGGAAANGPSIFSLQRLVDVADFNMDVRPRLVWAQVWELMSDFFVGLACHEKAMVSVFAIDSLKQLSLKFLEKPELSEFNFQSSFLKPFLIVMEEKKSQESIRELVLQCIDNIIRSKAHNLRSGWKVMFSILTVSARDPSERIEHLALGILQRLLDEHLDDIESLVAGECTDASEESSPSPLEKRVRNTRVDDFVHLCKASLSFVQYDASDSLRPFGLTMRAFCHTAIYADVIASRRVLPPVSGAQCDHPDSPGYTYQGLSEAEQLDLVLWRPLLEGLAKGLRSSANTRATGFGCLIQRGSLLALRSILLRHGHTLSTTQLAAILSDTILPSIQVAAESDQSPVVTITSENPSISSIDFLVNALPLPPDHEHPSLQSFLEQQGAHKRSIGPAELMLEASLTDLRHGGNGDLRQSHVLAKKSSDDEAKVTEQPFPNSWIATTSSIALGMLTDLVTEFVVYRGEEGREKLWPLLFAIYRLWSVGHSTDVADTRWSPCEALTRIACRELIQIPKRVFAGVDFSDLPHSEQEAWVSVVLKSYQDILSSSVTLEESLRKTLLDAKGPQSVSPSVDDMDFDAADQRSNSISTPFGQGRVKSVIETFYKEDRVNVSTSIIELDFGATLYQPAIEGSHADCTEVEGIPYEVDVPDAYWVTLVPALKIRCVTAHCLHEALDGIVDVLIPKASNKDLESLLTVMETSRQLAASTVKNESVSMAFRESLLKDWGDGVGMPDETSETTARLALLHGSDVFFLTQEAGAAKTYIHILSLLYATEASESHPDLAFAEPLLTSFMVDVLDNFLLSEERDGHLIDPNIWRRAIEGHGKVALYCTTFAPTIVEILKVIRSLSPNQFEQHKHDLYPRICALVRVQSEEIRCMVQDVLATHVARAIGVVVP